MYQTQREAPITIRKSRPKYSDRKIAFTPAFVSDFHNTPFENTRNQALGYTKESHTDIDRNIPLGNLSYAPIQAKPDPQPDPQKEEFFSTLITTIKGHIASARLDLPNPTSRHEALWDSIKKGFETYGNMEILVSKILSFNTPGVENPFSYNSVYCDSNYTRYINVMHTTVSNVFEHLDIPICQTLNDIFYWTSCDNAETVSTIKLTDSDLHHRGVGVCIVEYRNATDKKKIVVKPEDKSFEQIVYGSGTESLANEFNTSLNAGALGSNFKNSRIGTLDIQTSQNNEHGSAMEFFEHQRFSDIVTNNQTNLIDNRSVKSLIAFSSLLGLADLHVENAVYSKKAGKPFEIQLIDAEIGMKYLLSSADDLALLQTAMHSGEMSGLAPSIDSSRINRIDFEGYRDIPLNGFLDNAKDKLKKAKSRIVLIPTSTLFQYRTCFLTGLPNWDVSAPGKTYSSELLNAAKTYYKDDLTAIFLQKPKICKDSAEKDFAAGRIPFFELDFSAGKIWQILPGESIPIATYMGSDNTPFLDVMIESRKAALNQEYNSIQKRKNIHRLKVGFAALLCASAGGFCYLYFGRG